MKVEESSTITLSVYHVSSSSKETLRGTTVVSVKEAFRADRSAIMSEHRINHSGPSVHKNRGVLIVSLRLKEDKKISSDATPPIYDTPSVVDNVETAGIAGSSTPLANNTLQSRKASNEDVSTVAAAVERAGTTMAVEPADHLETVLHYVDRVVSLGSAISQVHPYAKLAWDILTVAHKVFKSVRDRDDKINALLLSIVDMLGFMKEIEPLPKIRNLQDTVSAMMKQIYECALFIRAYGEKSFTVRVVRDAVSSSDDEAIQRFILEVNRLRALFDEGINIQTWIVIRNVENNVAQLNSTLEEINDSEKEKRLKSLPGADLHGVRFDEEYACLGGTRQELLRTIQLWVHSPQSKRILWLSGVAGSGKSSVANSVAILFDGLTRLGASFRFKRDADGLNTPDNLFGNLSYQLSHFNRRLRDEVLSVIDAMGHVGGWSLQSQIKRLVVDTTKAAELAGPVVIVIDAVDECGSKIVRRDLLRAIATQFSELPTSVKIVMTSRDEMDIRASLEGCAEELRIDHQEGTAEDIAHYFRSRIEAMKKEHLHLALDWPSPVDMQELNRRADCLFIWAAVACNFMEEEGEDPSFQLIQLLDATQFSGQVDLPFKSLDNLYHGVIANAFPGKAAPLDNFRYVVGAIVAAKVPLTQTALDRLLGLGPGLTPQTSTVPGDGHIRLSSSAPVVSRLRSILKVDPSDICGKKGLIRLLHPSLYDFLTTRADAPLRLDISVQNHALALRCLTVMNSELKHDICDIADSTLFNQEVDDLQQRIDSNISQALCYSCRFFADHLADLRNPSTELTDALDEFASKNLLHWVEAMSLLSQINEAETSLTVLTGWMKGLPDGNTTTTTLAYEATLFLKNFGHAIRHSALHIYASAIPLTPETTLLFKIYGQQLQKLPDIKSSHRSWDTSVRTLEGHTDGIRSIALAPDGRTMASASRDETVRIWDVKTGQTTGPALKGHKDIVNHVVFSPDGKKLASGSVDATVRLWDMETLQVIVLAPMIHKKGVSSVAFSPNGTMIASASDDRTVGLWDVYTGKPILAPLDGHSGKVRSVVFSPDGRKLATASYDNMARVWDVCTGQSKTLQGHTKYVALVIFSPDGTKLASASFDQTVRLWDAETGDAIGLPLVGPKYDLRNWTYGNPEWLVFSPDGKRLASAACSRTVLLWDVETGNAFGSPLAGHSDFIWAVVFSPDGKKIASASHDRSVRLWDVESSKAIGSAIVGHADIVYSLRFLLDEETLASASEDGTVRLWDIKNAPTAEYDHHVSTGKVNLVLISPDSKKVVSVTLCRSGIGTSTSAVQLWDFRTSRAIGLTFEIESNRAPSPQACFSINGRNCACSADMATVELFDAMTGGHIQSITLPPAPISPIFQQFRQFRFSPDGTLATVRRGAKTVQVWDAQSGNAIREVVTLTEDIVSFEFSPNGETLITMSQHRAQSSLQLWDVNTGNEIHSVIPNSNYSISTWYPPPAFSPDGSMLAFGYILSSQTQYQMGSLQDQLLQVWDVKTGHSVGPGLKFSSCHWPSLVKMSPDGQRLACIDFAEEMQLWHIETGEKLGIPLGRDDWDAATLAEFGINFPLRLDDSNFMRRGHKKLLWLPAVLRSHVIDSRDSAIVVGGLSGAITFIQLAPEE